MLTNYQKEVKNTGYFKMFIGILVSVFAVFYTAMAYLNFPPLPIPVLHNAAVLMSGHAMATQGDLLIGAILAFFMLAWGIIQYNEGKKEVMLIQEIEKKFTSQSSETVTAPT